MGTVCSGGTGSLFPVWYGLILSAVYFFIYLKLDPSNFSLKNTSETLIPLILISLFFIPFQAAFEEVLFRGYLMQGFAVILRNRWFPLHDDLRSFRPYACL